MLGASRGSDFLDDEYQLGGYSGRVGKKGEEAITVLQPNEWIGIKLKRHPPVVAALAALIKLEKIWLHWQSGA